MRRRVITEIMCNFKVRFSALEIDFDMSYKEYFAHELGELQKPGGQEEQGFVELGPEDLVVTSLRRIFVRNVCMVFDRHLRKKNQKKPIFSQTV